MGCILGGIVLIGYGLGAFRNMTISVRKVTFPYVSDISVCYTQLPHVLAFTTHPAIKSQQHPKDFPSGHPPQYYPGLPPLNFGVRMGSGAFDGVWPLTAERCYQCLVAAGVSKRLRSNRLLDIDNTHCLGLHAPKIE